MTQFAYCSDLHLEFKDIILDKVDSDVLVLAGDIIPIMAVFNAISNRFKDSHNIIDFFESISNQYSHILYVLGNHEFYHGDFNMIDHYRNILKSYNVTILNNEAIEINDIKVYGGTLWTSLNNNDPLLMMQAPKIMNDFRTIRDNDQKFNVNSWLKHYHEFFDNYQESDVIITHHLPSTKIINPAHSNKFKQNYLYASDLENFILDHPVKYWVHGHSHDAIDAVIGNCQVISNARGYPSENGFRDFKLKTFTV